MPYEFADIAESNELKVAAARILTSTFLDKGNSAWPDLKSALAEVEECVDAPNFAIGLLEGGKLLGWVGLRPMYDKTWELHPLVVKTESQGKGIGALLLGEVERVARGRGLIGIMLGTDDEFSKTSLSQTDLSEGNLLREIEAIRNLDRHPFEFYKKCGYFIVGVAPNANGPRKPDIWMWKSLL